MMTDDADKPATPKFRWVFSSRDYHWQLREVGETHSYATVFSLSSDLHRSARRAGYYYAVYIEGTQAAYFKDSKDARAWAFEETAAERATKNSIAWEAGRPARQAARRAVEETRARAAAEALATAFARKRVQLLALDALIARGADDMSDLQVAVELRDELQAELARLAEGN